MQLSKSFIGRICQKRAQYDVVFTDEVITHFYDIGDFYSKCNKVLKPGGIMLNKELHLTRAEHSGLGPASEHVNKIYGYTGNYRPFIPGITGGRSIRLSF